MMELTLRQMRYAVALANEKHFGRAAERCHISQPALSQQIRQIEQACGAALFERIGRTVSVTPFGVEFLSRTERALRECDTLMAFAHGHGGRPSSPLRFGLIPTVAPYLLPVVYPSLKSELSDVEFAMRENRTADLLRGLETGTLDLALIATKLPDETRLRARPLFSDPFVLAAGNGVIAQDPVDLSRLPAHDILLLDDGHCFRDQAIEACALRDTDGAFAATSLSTIVEFVANGQGITLLPAISLRKESTDPRIRVHALSGRGASRSLYLVWRAATPFGALFEEIAHIVQREGEKLLAEPVKR